MRDREVYDLAVIGAGSAGFSAAITAAELGARVALIGHGTIGGTCVNTGCVPSKNLIRAIEPLHHAAAAARFGGINAEVRVTDWGAVMCGKDALVSSLRQAKYIDLLPNYNTVTYLEGWARFSGGSVASDGKFIDAGKVIIATGASPALPLLPGIEAVPPSDEHDGSRARPAAAITADHRWRLHWLRARRAVRARRGDMPGSKRPAK